MSTAAEDELMVGRWGGEEFVIVCRGKDCNTAQEIAEKLRNKVEEYLFPDILHITCSIGVTQIKKEDDFASAFDRIDKAMYEARNILCMTERQLIKYANVFFSDKQECLRLGKSAYRQGLYEEAMALLGGAGSKVDADAQFMIGQMYAKGRGVEKNKKIAEEWYWKAANQGHAAAALELEKGINRAKAYWKRKEQELIDEVEEFANKLLEEDG